MENKENKKVEITDLGIDADVLQDITKDDVLLTIENPELLNRAILNCFAETLSELKKVAKTLNQFYQTISICSQDKILDYFVKLNENVKAEENRLKAQEKIHADHKKTSKKSKKQ